MSAFVCSIVVGSHDILPADTAVIGSSSELPDSPWINKFVVQRLPVLSIENVVAPAALSPCSLRSSQSGTHILLYVCARRAANATSARLRTYECFILVLGWLLVAIRCVNPRLLMSSVRHSIDSLISGLGMNGQTLSIAYTPHNFRVRTDDIEHDLFALCRPEKVRHHRRINTVDYPQVIVDRRRCLLLLLPRSHRFFS